MGKRFPESARQSGELSAGSNAQNGLAEAEDAVGGILKSLRRGIIRITGDDNPNGMMRKERGGEAVSGSKKPVLRSNASKGFERFSCEIMVTLLAGENVHSNERNGRDGIGARRG